MPSYKCEFCNHKCLSRVGLSQHIVRTLKCSNDQKAKLGLTSSSAAKKRKISPPPAAAAAALASSTSNTWKQFKRAQFTRPDIQKKRNAASLEQLSPEQVQAVANLGAVLEEDTQARAQLFGKSVNNGSQKDTELQADPEIPAEELESDPLTEDNDDGAPDLPDPDAYFAAEEAAHLARTQQEVRNFMENDNVPLQPTLRHAQQQQLQQQVLQGLLNEDWNNNDSTINANPNTTM